MYDANNPSKYSRSDCDAAVGHKATLTLTGTIVLSGESDHGAFVKFQPDERFGFGEYRFVLDLDALEMETS